MNCVTVFNGLIFEKDLDYYDSKSSSNLTSGFFLNDIHIPTQVELTFGLKFGPGSTFFKTREKRLNSDRILSRTQNWGKKQAQLSKKNLIGITFPNEV